MRAKSVNFGKMSDNNLTDIDSHPESNTNCNLCGDEELMRKNVLCTLKVYFLW